METFGSLLSTWILNTQPTYRAHLLFRSTHLSRHCLSIVSCRQWFARWHRSYSIYLPYRIAITLDIGVDLLVARVGLLVFHLAFVVPGMLFLGQEGPNGNMARQVSPSPAGKNRSSTTDLHNKVTASSKVLSDVENLQKAVSMFAVLADTPKLRALSKVLSNITNDIDLSVPREVVQLQHHVNHTPTNVRRTKKLEKRSSSENWRAATLRSQSYFSCLEKTMTCKSKPRSPLKEVITKAFKDHSHPVKLKPIHDKALIDFLTFRRTGTSS